MRLGSSIILDRILLYKYVLILQMFFFYRFLGLLCRSLNSKPLRKLSREQMKPNMGWQPLFSQRILIKQTTFLRACELERFGKPLNLRMELRRKKQRISCGALAVHAAVPNPLEVYKKIFFWSSFSPPTPSLLNE